MISILLNTETSEVFYMCCQVLCEMFTKKWSIFNTSHRVLVYTFVLKKLHENGIIYAEKGYLDCIVRLVCRIARQSWNEDVEFTKLPEYCKMFLVASPGIMCIGLRIIESLIEDMGPASDYQLMQHQRNSKHFKNWTLPVFFCDSVACLSNLSTATLQEKINTIDLVLKIVSKTLDFCKPDKEDTEFTPPAYNSDYWNILKSPSLVQQLISIYQEYVSETKITKNILKIFGLVVKISPDFFGGQSIKDEITNKVICIVQGIMTTKLGLDSEDNLFEFVWLLSKIFTSNISFDLLVSMNFGTLVTGCYELTIQVLSSGNENLLNNMLGFWESICKYQNDSDELSLCIFEVTKLYIQYCLQQKISGEDQETIKSNISCISNLSKVKFCDITAWVLGLFEKFTDDFINSNTSPDVLSTVIYILSSFIPANKLDYYSSIENSKKSNSETVPRPNEEYKANSDIIYHVIVLTKHLLDSLTPYSSVTEASIMFIKVFLKLYLKNTSTNSSETLKNLLEKLSFSQSSQILILVLSLIFRLLETRCKEVYKACIEIFSDITGYSRVLKPTPDSQAAVYCGKIEFEENAITEILQKWTSNSFSFMDSKAPDKSRVIFVKSIFQLYFLSINKGSISMLDMLVPIETSINELKATKNNSIVQSLYYDLLGILLSISNSDQYSLFFNWFSLNIDFLLEVFDYYHQTEPNYSLLFDFLKELSFNRTERMTYIENKAICGSVFWFCDQILKKYFSREYSMQSAENSYELLYKPLSKGIHVYSNILTGNYISINVLVNQSDVIESLKLVIGCILRIPAEEVTYFIKIFRVVYELLKFITGNSGILRRTLYLISSAQGEKLFDLIIEGCQSSEQYVCQLSYMIIKDIVYDMIFKSSPQSQDFKSRHQNSLLKLLRVLFVIVLGGEAQNLSLISYPILGLVNMFKEFYVQMVPSLCFVQGPERKEL